jgi:hypothetical protein
LRSRGPVDNVRHPDCRLVSRPVSGRQKTRDRTDGSQQSGTPSCRKLFQLRQL